MAMIVVAEAVFTRMFQVELVAQVAEAQKMAIHHLGQQVVLIKETLMALQVMDILVVLVILLIYQEQVAEAVRVLLEKLELEALVEVMVETVYNFLFLEQILIMLAAAVVATMGVTLIAMMA
jgi:hypothetical protein